MDIETFTDNHLVNQSGEQFKEFFDMDAIQELANTEQNRDDIRMLSQYIVGNITETFKEVSEVSIGIRESPFITWVEVANMPEPVKQMVRRIIYHLEKK